MSSTWRSLDRSTTQAALDGACPQVCACLWPSKLWVTRCACACADALQLPCARRACMHMCASTNAVRGVSNGCHELMPHCVHLRTRVPLKVTRHADWFAPCCSSPDCQQWVSTTHTQQHLRWFTPLHPVACHFKLLHRTTLLNISTTLLSCMPAKCQVTRVAAGGAGAAAADRRGWRHRERQDDGVLQDRARDGGRPRRDHLHGQLLPAPERSGARGRERWAARLSRRACARHGCLLLHVLAICVSRCAECRSAQPSNAQRARAWMRCARLHH